MQSKVLVDAGPLVALVDINDEYHAISKSQFDAYPIPGFTTWAVLTEVAWLVRRSPGGFTQILRLLEAGAIVCVEPDAGFPVWCRDFLHQYRDLQPQVADATLVYLADKLDTRTIFTLDRRDFTVFRNRRGQAFQLLPESLNS